MGGVRIIAGGLKGRLIPFENRKFDDADITPQKVKGAVFSMIGEYLHGQGFLDLYAGSGQIGIEALSRGADPVVFNDRDARRCRFIASYCEGLGMKKQPLVLNMSAERAVVFLGSRRILFRHIFLDPPYEKIKRGVSVYPDVIRKIGEAGMLAPDGDIIIQHFTGNVMDEEIGKYSLTATKRYGRTALSVYSLTP
ncbi:MAG: RsmD family RNA methyltransferase [Spirochaetes bacterium]|nr:RsmD family RNA methyltransferase [Spirochaetota bacterium]